MTDDEVGAETRRVLAVDEEAFARRVEADAELVRSELAAGTFDNPRPAIGLEYEFYAVDRPSVGRLSGEQADDPDTASGSASGPGPGPAFGAAAGRFDLASRPDADPGATSDGSSDAPSGANTDPDVDPGADPGADPNAEFDLDIDADAGRRPGTLARIPRHVLSLWGFEKELGLHNAELRTTPQPLNEHGFAAQAAELRARLTAADRRAAGEGLALVSDGLWTIPPVGETALGYLTDAAGDDLTLAANMSDAARYHAIQNADVAYGGGIDAPNVSVAADAVLVESLATSIQPHHQVPDASDLPAYFGYALRIAGPVLALAANSPLFPPDLYDDVAPERVLAEAHAEHRIGVFETAMNSGEVRKVRFPADLSSTREAVDRVVEDDTIVPMPPVDGDRFDDEFGAFRTKHGTYWRWVRPVFGGPTRSQASVRVEFRPLPAQPTVRDSVALLATVAGALEGLTATDHPVADLSWDQARENFYAAARDGLAADLTWIDADGRQIEARADATATGDGRRGDGPVDADRAALYEDLFDVVETGLRSRGLSADRVATLLAPLRARLAAGTTPADWKLRIARRRAAAGDGLRDAVWAAQRAYLRAQSGTLLDGSFADWPAPESVVRTSDR